MDNFCTSPSEVGYDSEKLLVLDSHLQNLINDKKIMCGRYLLSKDNKIFTKNAIGNFCYDDANKKASVSDIRRVYSITKLFTSVAILKLIEIGKIYLDQPVSTIIDEFKTPIHEKIQIFHLLTHTSGLYADPGFFTEPYPFDYRIDEPNWIKSCLLGPLQYKTGESFAYCTIGFNLLAEIVTRISGKDYEDYVLEEIARPLGMNDTFFDVPEELHSRVAYINEWSKNSIKKVRNRKTENPRGGGGIYSTMEDLWKFGSMILNNGTFNGVKILSRKSNESFTTNHLYGVSSFYWGAELKDFKYGLGISFTIRTLCSPETVAHEGYAGCALYIDPKEKFIAIWDNHFEEWIPEAMINVKNIIWSGII